MPKETNLAARNNHGDMVLFRDSSYPSAQTIELFEKYHPGAAGILLDMVKTDQAHSFVLANRDSKLEFWTRILGMVFAFILTLALILSGVLLILKDAPITGCVTLFTGIVGIISLIATGGKMENKRKK